MLVVPPFDMSYGRDECEYEPGDILGGQNLVNVLKWHLSNKEIYTGVCSFIVLLACVGLPGDDATSCDIDNGVTGTWCSAITDDGILIELLATSVSLLTKIGSN